MLLLFCFGNKDVESHLSVLLTTIHLTYRRQRSIPGRTVERPKRYLGFIYQAYTCIQTRFQYIQTYTKCVGSESMKVIVDPI